MDSSASHPPGFSRRWASEGSPESVSSASPRRHDHVSGLGISSASSGGSVAPRPEVGEQAPPEGRARVQDRLVWELPKPSKGKKWTRRLETRQEAGTAGWGAAAQEMRGLCFRCFLPGHRKRDCTNAEVCMRCWQKGHPAMECKRPRSPSSEEELRQLALAKLARRRSPERARQGPQGVRGARASSPPLPPPPSPPQAPPCAMATPPPPPPPLAASRLPPMGAWPPLAVEPPAMSLSAPSLAEAVGPPLLCVVRRSAGMCDLEPRLQLALVATVGGRRPAVTCEQVAAALRWRGVPEGTVSVHAFAPEDFLVVCETLELREHVAAMPAVLVAGAPLSFRPWNRQAQAALVPMSTRVMLVLEGLPPHAWDTSVVEDLLGKSCAIDAVAPETKERRDLSLFKLAAWTSDLEAIPVARLLAIPEPVLGGGARAAPVRTAAAVVADAGSGREAIKTLQYRVLVHLVRVEEEVSQLAGVRRGLGGGEDRGLTGPREFGGGSGDGSGGSAGGGPRRASRDLPWQRGVPDRRRGPGGVSSVACGGERFPSAPAPAPEKRWALPVVGSPAPLTVQTAAASQPVGPRLPGSARTAPVKATLAAEEDGKAPDKAALTAVGDQETVGPLHGVHGLAEKEPLLEGDVVACEPRGQGVDQVVWSDAPETLPVVDPEALEPSRKLHADEVGQGNRSSQPPSVSLLEPTSGDPDMIAQVEGAGSDGGSAEAFCAGEEGFRKGKEEYFCVSISESVHRGRETLSVPGSQLVEDVEELGSGQASSGYTGPNSLMQMVPRGLGHQLEEEAGVPDVPDRVLVQEREKSLEEIAPGQEKLELVRIKRFCSSILKTLAPPLLSEFEKATGLRADAEPFTPKRVTRRSMAERAGTQVKMASAAESTLLRALGFCPENFAVSDEDLRRFKDLFDSPVRDAQLRVLAAIFGKELPLSFEEDEHCTRAVAAQ
ncbi:hypothetical protein QYE76_051641 [Lolium multiflorum]|uniref:CCHC-type domain-containing protein n=1 Tax=Lolium multiflorum TaxID=4521 RepID=A0AAD8STS3_LOLMU|nr:hypothetical protein QYE76_051641 [Lolium multiflorum]